MRVIFRILPASGSEMKTPGVPLMSPMLPISGHLWSRPGWERELWVEVHWVGVRGRGGLAFPQPPDLGR